MTRQELAKRIYETSHLTGTFLLRSGVESHEYFDKYRFESNPELLAEIALQMTALLPKEFDAQAGLEMGGIPIGTAISFNSHKPSVFVRKKAKAYGTCRIAEGIEIAGKDLVIIEDVVTSGGQVVISAQELRDQGATVKTALCVIDREAGGKEALAAVGIELRPLFTMSEIKSLL
jgi:orotate phosphoribosyltransferase